jgi:hypothetical protein
LRLVRIAGGGRLNACCANEPPIEIFCPAKRGLMQPVRRCLWLAAALALGVSTAAAQDSSCQNTAGPERSAGYVRQCVEVTPATHPPCNAQNPCELIIGEIARGCWLIREDVAAHSEWRPSVGLREPAWCAAYIGDRR